MSDLLEANVKGLITLTNDETCLNGTEKALYLRKRNEPLSRTSIAPKLLKVVSCTICIDNDGPALQPALPQ